MSATLVPDGMERTEAQFRTVLGTLGFSLEDITPALRDGRALRVLSPGPIWAGRLSPDGRWLAYCSLERSDFEISGRWPWLALSGMPPDARSRRSSDGSTMCGGRCSGRNRSA
jgi:hypothetical protein